MPAKNIKLTIRIEKPLYSWLKKESKKRGISLSRSVRDIINEAYEREQNIYWAREGEERIENFDRRKAISHEDFWGEN